LSGCVEILTDWSTFADEDCSRFKARVEKELPLSPWFRVPGAVEFKRPVQLEHALSHIDHPQPSRFSGLVGVATNSIIGNRKANATALSGTLDATNKAARV